MKFASQDLRDEHEAILYGLDILEELADRLEDRQPVEIEDLEALVDFLRLFADRCHHGKEEGLYFDNFSIVHEDEERPVVEGAQEDVLAALKELIDEGRVVVNDTQAEPVFLLGRA